ncbi:uncharacterized protein METZ01_LOCUS333816, partial [marine metagenome]
MFFEIRKEYIFVKFGKKSRKSYVIIPSTEMGIRNYSCFHEVVLAST